MWPNRSAQGQGGVEKASAGVASHQEGARPKILNSPTADNKSGVVYDSHNDSGFLSGSNLVSSSSLSCDDTSCSMRSENLLSGEVSLTHPSLSDPKNVSQVRQDSGIDISDQLSSLHLASPTTSSSSAASEACEAETSPTRKPATPPPRRSRLSLSEAQVGLLQEIFQTDEDGDTQLHVAVMQGFIEVVYHITRLLPHQAFLDLANHSGRTALHLAVATGDAGVVRHLVVCGASPVSRDRRGNTPLHLACAQGDILMATQLTRPVTVAEVINARLSYAPAHTAGLLAADLANYDGQTCIHVAALGGHKEILQHLTWYGADINAREGKSGRTALHYAVEARDASLVAFLTESCGVSFTLETYAGFTPYQLALANGATGLAKLLLELGAPSDPLPLYLMADDDLEYDEVSGAAESTNGWGALDDLRIGGVPVPIGMPVSVNDNDPLNADNFF
ncbi:NF-kappa-B inhibitor alpha-like [Homarus americanus]|uniref:NF-kappa-B inhibitor alpha-like n=1 Tax=Homarus americanus TaxID=6706 RepID=UPI001C450502|nr:NF-kappa-B inhibitor alpha-like [Homarus americanus]